MLRSFSAVVVFGWVIAVTNSSMTVSMDMPAIEFKRLLGHLAGKQLVETDTAAELSGHRRTG